MSKDAGSDSSVEPLNGSVPSNAHATECHGDGEIEARIRAAELEVRKETQDAWKQAFELGFDKCKAQLQFAKELLGSGFGASM